MKKLFTILALTAVLMSIIVPVSLVYGAPTGVTGPPDLCKLRHDVKMPDGLIVKGTEVSATTRDDWGLVCLIDKVYNLVDWLYWIILAVSGIVVLWGALIYITAQGDAAKVTKAKGLIAAAIGGLLVALFAKAIPSIIIAIFA